MANSNSTDRNEWEGITKSKRFGAGALIVATEDVASKLEDLVNAELQRRRELAKNTFQSLKDMVRKIKEPKPKYTRKELKLLFARHGINPHSLTGVEFIHVFAVSCTISPADIVIPESVREKVLQDQRDNLSGTPYEEYINAPVALNKTLRNAYESLIRNNQDEFADRYYLVGIEPNSVHSMLRGYRKPGLSLFMGSSNSSDRSFLDCARREFREETSIARTSYFDYDTQHRLQKCQPRFYMTDDKEMRVYLFLLPDDFEDDTNEEDELVNNFKKSCIVQN